jgi:hypothetical protein
MNSKKPWVFNQIQTGCSDWYGLVTTADHKIREREINTVHLQLRIIPGKLELVALG